jgi:hypothetical protein
MVLQGVNMNEETGLTKISAFVYINKSNGCMVRKSVTVEYGDDTLQSARERIKIVRDSNKDIQIVGRVEFIL